MHPLSRLSHIPASFTRNKNLDTSPSHSGNHTSDSSSDSAIHVHRAPLAQIDQQLFNPAPTDIISPALTPLSTASFDSIPLTTRTFGKSMTPRRSSYTAEDILYSAGNGSQNSVHRRSSQSRTIPTAPYPPSKPTRRPAHTHTQSTSSLISTRRGSLPALHLHSTPSLSISPPNMQEDSENLNDDEYYAFHSLATFSFGSATAHRQSYDPDMPSPLSIQAPSDSSHSQSTTSSDRTPRPSISHTRGPDDDRAGDESRRTRAKMRAIDDGGRRPSLPTNLYTSDRPSADSLPDPSSRRRPHASGSDSDPTASSGASDADIDPGSESGMVDTDVELDGIPAYASRNTFGLNQVRSTYTFDSGPESDGDGLPGTQECVEWYIVDPNERRQEAGSPVIFASAGSDDDNDDDDDADSDVSETGTRGLAAMRRNSVAIRIASVRDPSFHSTDTEPAQTRTNIREREDSIATVRRPSYDLEAGSHTASGSDREQQPALPPANWSMFTNPSGVSPPDDSGEHVYQGIDLDYIMSVGGSAVPGSRRSSHSFVAPQPLPLPPSGKSRDKDKRKKDKGKVKGVLDVAAMQGLIGQPNPPPNLLDVAPWATDADDMTGPRRPSTVTLDDSFAGGLRRLDPDYAIRRNEWSFIRELERIVVPPRDPDRGPRTWDIWRCAQIGQIRIERAVLPPSDPEKPNQQRLNAEHDIDPESANILGGPTTVVHRHSRALAFSIYRHYNLRNSRARESGTRNSTTTTSSTRPRSSTETRGGTFVMPTHDGILLATKRVQEHFTFTKSTSRLDAHGLLPDDGGDGRRDPHSRRAQQDRSGNPSHRDSPGNRQIVDLSRFEDLANQAMGLRRSPSTRTDNSSTAFASSSTSHKASSASSVGTSSSPTSPVSEQPLISQEEDSDGDLVNPVPRTSHAEAFATLDNYAIDQLKNGQLPAVATRRTHGSWIQRIIGPPSSTSRMHSPNLSPINPPWMTLVSRSMQEEQDRAIQGLRSSFKDVGLVPSSRSHRGAGIGRKGMGKNKDMLTQVPDDSLYMLLPLWPHETDPASAARERSQRSTKGSDREQNLYLLVYYVPFDKHGEGSPPKKRSRSRKDGDRERRHPMPLFDVRLGFKVVGRLIAHADLNGSGIRLPVRGLSVTGSLAEAELGIPSASLRDVHSDDFIIGACLDRSGTIEFVPEGLEKLGLCVPRTEPHIKLHTHPGMQTADPVEEEVVPQPLTAIGRAAVEIAWLGCMALTTFYGPPSKDRA